MRDIFTQNIRITKSDFAPPPRFNSSPKTVDWSSEQEIFASLSKNFYGVGGRGEDEFGLASLPSSNQFVDTFLEVTARQIAGLYY